MAKINYNSLVFKQPLKSKEQKELFEILNSGDCNDAEKENARGKIIEHNLRLVAFVARKYRTKNFEFDEIINIGSIGLMKAVNTFKPENEGGARFATYASTCINNEILMSLRKTKKTEKDISIESPVSIDNEGNESNYYDVLSDESRDVSKTIEDKLLIEQINLLVKELPKLEKQIMTLRYGLNGEKALIQQEIADKLKISRSYVSRIEHRAIKKIQTKLNDDKLD
jgi:RNA polymerase sporulation-specific sigma factor